MYLTREGETAEKERGERTTARTGNEKLFCSSLSAGGSGGASNSRAELRGRMPCNHSPRPVGALTLITRGPGGGPRDGLAGPSSCCLGWPPAAARLNEHFAEQRLLLVQRLGGRRKRQGETPFPALLLSSWSAAQPHSLPSLYRAFLDPPSAWGGAAPCDLRPSLSPHPHSSLPQHTHVNPLCRGAWEGWQRGRSLKGRKEVSGERDAGR